MRSRGEVRGERRGPDNGEIDPERSNCFCGGMFIHVIDPYPEDEPAANHVKRFDAYRSWITSSESEHDAIGRMP